MFFRPIALAIAQKPFLRSAIILPVLLMLLTIAARSNQAQAQPLSCPDPATYPGHKPALLGAFDPSTLAENGPRATTVCSGISATAPCAAHLVFVPSPLIRRDQLQKPLVLFLPGTGMIPYRQTLLLRTAAFAGYRTIGLSYNNVTSVSSVCDGSACGTDCHGEARAEAVSGRDLSGIVDIKRGDSILYRLYNLLVELHQQDLRDGVNDYHWNQFYVRQGRRRGQLHAHNIVWDKIIVAGFSQGAGHAAWISKAILVSGMLIIDGANGTCTASDGSVQPADWLLEPQDASAGRPRYGIGYAHAGLVSGPPYVAPSTWQALGLGLNGSDDLDDGPIALPPLDAAFTAQTPACGPNDNHLSMGRDGCMPVSFSPPTSDLPIGFPAFEPNHVYLFKEYLVRFCFANGGP
jgi:hypothetical protein